MQKYMTIPNKNVIVLTKFCNICVERTATIVITLT